MYVIDDICYASTYSKDTKIIAAKPLVGRMLLVTFASGEQRLYDTTQLTGSAFDALNDENIFNNPVLFHGIITWNDGEIDIAPETVYADSIPYNTEMLA